MIQYMQKTTERCIKRHQFCQLPTSTFAPTRLIDICNKLHPRLFVTDEEFHEKYATLSYCWGNEKLPLRTLNSNINEMVGGISLKEYVTYSSSASHC